MSVDGVVAALETEMVKEGEGLVGEAELLQLVEQPHGLPWISGAARMVVARVPIQFGGCMLRIAIDRSVLEFDRRMAAFRSASLKA